MVLVVAVTVVVPSNHSMICVPNIRRFHQRNNVLHRVYCRIDIRGISSWCRQLRSKHRCVGWLCLCLQLSLVCPPTGSVIQIWGLTWLMIWLVVSTLGIVWKILKTVDIGTTLCHRMFSSSSFAQTIIETSTSWMLNKYLVRDYCHRSLSPCQETIGTNLLECFSFSFGCNILLVVGESFERYGVGGGNGAVDAISFILPPLQIKCILVS